MKTTLIKFSIAALAAACACGATAAVIQTTGAASSVKTVLHAADFELNTTQANDYAEGGLLFRYTGSGNNNECGYAGFDCYDDPSELGAGFAGNYMATAGNNAYVSVRKGDGSDFNFIEFAAGSGYASVFGHWKTYNDSVLTGSGNFSSPNGLILGLSDLAGFDEVRYFAFSSNGRTTGFSSAAIDSVRVGVPEPESMGMFGLGLLGMAGLLRRRKAK